MSSKLVTGSFQVTTQFSAKDGPSEAGLSIPQDQWESRFGGPDAKSLTITNIQVSAVSSAPYALACFISCGTGTHVTSTGRNAHVVIPPSTGHTDGSFANSVVFDLEDFVAESELASQAVDFSDRHPNFRMGELESAGVYERKAYNCPPGTKAGASPLLVHMDHPVHEMINLMQDDPELGGQFEADIAAYRDDVASVQNHGPIHMDSEPCIPVSRNLFKGGLETIFKNVAPNITERTCNSFRVDLERADGREWTDATGARRAAVMANHGKANNLDDMIIEATLNITIDGYPNF